MPPDIYTYPSQAPSLAYMVAVMTAAASGATVERRGTEHKHQWYPILSPSWNWEVDAFRIKRPLCAKDELEKGDWVIGTHASVLGLIGRISSIGQATLSYPSSISLQCVCGSWSPNWFRHATEAEVAAHLKSQAQNQIAPGHNPSRLTCAEVQTQDGWRLLDTDELKAHAICGIPVEYWDNRWIGPCVSYANSKWSYRTKLSRAELAALDTPAPKVKTPLCADDLPPICWIRFNDMTAFSYLVISVGVSDESGYVEIDNQHVTFRRLMDHDYQYSSDRKTWKPCHKLA